MNEPVRLMEAPWVHQVGRNIRAVRWLRVRPLFVVWAGLPYAAMTLIGPLKSFVLIHVGLMVGVVTAILAIQRRAARIVRAHYRDPDPNDPAELGIVLVTFRFDKVAYAEDIGFLTIDDHYFHFEGSQTSFSLAGSRTFHAEGDAIELRDAPRYSIVFGSLARSSRRFPGFILPTVEEIGRRWSRMTEDPEAGDQVGLPPLRPPRPSPQRVRRCQIAYACLTILLPIIAIVVATVFADGVFLRLTVIVLGVLLSALAAKAPFTLERSYQQQLRWADASHLPIDRREL